jgi:hypothetical protein
MTGHVLKRAVPGGGTKGPNKVLKGTVIKPRRTVSRPAASVPGKPQPAARAKAVFGQFADHLAQIAGMIKSLRELERQGKHPAGTANKLQAALGEFMTIAEELSAHEASARLNAIQEEANKAVKSARVVSVAPATTPSQAHALAGAFGIRRSAEAAEADARRITEVRRAAAKAEASQTGHPGRPVDVPAAARPSPLGRPVPSAQERPVAHTGGAFPFISAELATVWQAVYALWSRAGRLPVSVDPTEIARLTALSVEKVRAALTALEQTGQLQREPGRAGAAFVRYSPVI